MALTTEKIFGAFTDLLLNFEFSDYGDLIGHSGSCVLPRSFLYHIEKAPLLARPFLLASRFGFRWSRIFCAQLNAASGAVQTMNSVPAASHSGRRVTYRAARQDFDSFLH